MTITLPEGFELPEEPEFEILVRVRVEPESMEATVLEVDGIPVDEPAATEEPSGFVEGMEAAFPA